MTVVGLVSNRFIPVAWRALWCTTAHDLFSLFICLLFVCSCRYELLLYPRYHLDQSSLLCRKTLLGKPIVMDVFQNYILVTYNPFDVHIFHVKISGELVPAGSPVIQVWSNLLLLFSIVVNFSRNNESHHWLCIRSLKITNSQVHLIK